MAEPAPNDLLPKIQAALEHDERINLHHWPLQIQAHDGTVVLEGRVENIATKRMTLDAVRRLAQEPWIILDRLRVDTAADDAPDLGGKAIKALTQESAFRDYSLIVETDSRVETVHDAGPQAYLIRVNVEEGIVTLTGTVGSLSHRRLAEVLVWWTANCQGVNNLLDVAPPQDDNDDELTDIIRMVLEKDPLVHAHQLVVTTHQGIVELHGSVASEEEKRLAVLDAWYVPGVENVIDCIGVRCS